MRARKLSIGVGVVAAAMSAFALVPTAAYADYAPSVDDVVGVGSDTLQAGLDFIAGGDHLGDAGFNTGSYNKFISIDATADANTRLAYGVNGLGSGTCTPGTGGTQGTGNANTTHADKPCTLNPTVVLREGTFPVQRPNGSGAGYNLLAADTDTATGQGKGLVDFARRSSAAGASKSVLFDSVQIGNDPLGMLTSSTSNAAKTLSIPQLKGIYECTITNWNQVGGTAGTIRPLVPQVGSGTRDYFLKAIGVTSPGLCVTAVEENDPEAIDASGDPNNAVEPMSQSRLYLFQGKIGGTGASNGVGGYFKDPSCIGLSTVAPACTTGATLNPNVKLWTDADAVPSDGQAAFFPTRPLYVYFRHADINSTKPFQPGSSLNWVRTMLYNPGGAAPYVCSGTGQALLAAAGFAPVTNPDAGTTCKFTAAGP